MKIHEEFEMQCKSTTDKTSLMPKMIENELFFQLSNWPFLEALNGFKYDKASFSKVKCFHILNLCCLWKNKRGIFLDDTNSRRKSLIHDWMFLKL